MSLRDDVQNRFIGKYYGSPNLPHIAFQITRLEKDIIGYNFVVKTVDRTTGVQTERERILKSWEKYDTLPEAELPFLRGQTA